MEDKKICFNDLSRPLRFLIIFNWIQIGLLGIYLIWWLRVLVYIIFSI